MNTFKSESEKTFLNAKYSFRQNCNNSAEFHPESADQVFDEAVIGSPCWTAVSNPFHAPNVSSSSSSGLGSALPNISTRGQVGTQADVMIGGIIVAQDATVTITEASRNVLLTTDNHGDAGSYLLHRLALQGLTLLNPQLVLLLPPETTLQLSLVKVELLAMHSLKYITSSNNSLIFY